MQLDTVVVKSCTLCRNATDEAMGVSVHDDVYSYQLPCGHGAFFDVGAALWQFTSRGKADMVFEAMAGEHCGCRLFRNELHMYAQQAIQVGFTGRDLYVGYVEGEDLI